MNKIVVDVGIKENRIAVLEDGELVELYVERTDDERISGNVYKGRVTNVLPGMQAAFVDIGLEKNAFLYLKDALPKEVVESKNFDLGKYNIRDVLKTGQEIMVQILKEPFNTKGARITTQINIPGRYVVLMPYNDYIGVSKKIQEEKERKRLRETVKRKLNPGMGAVIRTLSEGIDGDYIDEDLDFILNAFKNIEREFNIKKAPSILYGGDMIQKVLRDYLNHSTEKVLINEKEKYDELKAMLSRLSSEYSEKLELFDESHDIFGYLGIESMIKNAIAREVVLKNGGSIVIDENEALTSIDVNTAKFIGNTDLEDTVLKVNIEAAKEIAKQLRLRNIGGIVIVDFIDMKRRENIDKMISVLEEELKKDRTTTSVLGMTRLGLLEMTRKKSTGRLTSRMLRKCPCCNGSGKIVSEEVIVTRIQNEVKRAKRNTSAKAIAFEINPLVMSYISEKKKDLKDVLKAKYDIDIILRGKDSSDFDHMKILRMGSKEYVDNFLKLI